VTRTDPGVAGRVASRSPGAPSRASALVAALTIGMLVVFLVIDSGRRMGGEPDAALPARPANHPPVVVMMDSPHPSRVYDEEVLQAAGTNADVLNDVPRDLPIQRVKEAAGPLWHRHEEIRHLDPELVIIHLSAFCTEECEPDRIKLRRFIEYLAPTNARILIYSRMSPDTLAQSYRKMLGELPQRFPSLTTRLSTFSLVAHGTPHWKDPATAAALKLRVKEILGLQ